VRAHVFQHVPFESLGSIEPWLQSAGADLTYTRFFEPHRLPAREDVDLLIILGGPMSANDEAMLPWLVPEKRFIRDAVDTGTPVLGICLGAQLIASARGARVYRNRQKEIGWFPIVATNPQGRADLFRFPDELTVFHWHGETFDLPPGAVQLARSVACEQQAFQIGSRTLGLQCHLETTRESAAGLIADLRAELTPGPSVQSEQEILGADDETYARINRTMAEVLGFLTR
jgi:GMP synthase-like glutamine amidotransferase